MAKRVKYQLTDDEVAILEQAIRHDERPEVRQRATAIHMLHLGNHPSEVAAVLVVGLGLYPVPVFAIIGRLIAGV